MKTETIKCNCGTSFDWLCEDERFRSAFMPERCNPCQAIHEAEIFRIREEQQTREAAERLASAKQSIEQRIQEITPPRYQQTDINHPSFNRSLWKTVSAWNPTNEVPFLGLIGVSGACKTRIGFMRFKEILTASIKPPAIGIQKIITPSFHAVSTPRLAQLVAAQFITGPRGLWDNDSKQDARQQLDSIRECDVLLIDDLGKAKNTPSVAAELFAIIDHRHGYNKTTIWTANSTPEEIVNGMSEDMAGPLAGRLIECSKIITIK